MQLTGDSAVHQSILMRSLQLCQVVLVPQTNRSRVLDALCTILALLVSGIRVEREETVHFWAEADKLCDRLAKRLVFELADHLVVCGVVEW